MGFFTGLVQDFKHPLLGWQFSFTAGKAWPWWSLGIPSSPCACRIHGCSDLWGHLRVSDDAVQYPGQSPVFASSVASFHFLPACEHLCSRAVPCVHTRTEAP